MSLPLRAHLIAGGFPRGQAAGHNHDYARLRLLEMLADAEAGRFDVLIVHKLDRFARNLRVTLETLDRLTRAADPAEAAAVRQRIGVLLDRSERELTALLGGLAKPPALPAVVGREPAPVER